MTPELLEQLYDFNHQPEYWELKNYWPSTQEQQADLTQWGGLLIDKALHIKVKHIEFNSPKKLTLTLPFWKTHRFG
ncbi:hypothetical protein CVT24_011758, partial [Panaeolus cyanescens]